MCHRHISGPSLRTWIRRAWVLPSGAEVGWTQGAEVGWSHPHHRQTEGGLFPRSKTRCPHLQREVCADPSDYVSGVVFSGNNQTSPQRFQQKGLFTPLTRIPGLKQQLQDAFRLFLPLAPKSVACRPLSPSLSYHSSPRTAQAPVLVFLLQVGRRGQGQMA